MSKNISIDYEEDMGPAFISLGVCALAAVMFVMLSVPMNIELPGFEQPHLMNQQMDQPVKQFNFDDIDLNERPLHDDYLMISKRSEDTIVINVGSEKIAPNQFTHSINHALQVYFSDLNAETFSVDIYFTNVYSGNETFSEKIRQLMIFRNHLMSLDVNISQMRVRLHPIDKIETGLVYIFTTRNNGDGLIMKF